MTKKRNKTETRRNTKTFNKFEEKRKKRIPLAKRCERNVILKNRIIVIKNIEQAEIRKLEA